jgi:signal transduction histidine kinase
MFHSARIKLTAWYLLIIMLISISFSVAIYRVLTSELDRVERVQRLRIERGLSEQPRMIPPFDMRDESSRLLILDPNLVEETKNRLLVMLGLINLAILATSSGAGYFLAGRTLKPISKMVDEQNRFITDASHELRIPLTSLKSEIEVNLRDKKLTLTGAKNLLESNLEEVNNLQVLSDGLIKLTQYQKGENGFTFSNISLVSIIDEAVKKVTKLAKNKSIAIINKVNDYTLEGSKPLLTELFSVFLDNAIKYSPKQSKVNLSSEKKDGNIFIHIKDQGIGISEEDIPHLFDRFYRADKSRTKSDVQGYGLGLSIAGQIIESHHGSIKVRSVLDEGTTFTIQIPVKHSPKKTWFSNLNQKY